MTASFLHHRRCGPKSDNDLMSLPSRYTARQLSAEKMDALLAFPNHHHTPAEFLERGLRSLSLVALRLGIIGRSALFLFRQRFSNGAQDGRQCGQRGELPFFDKVMRLRSGIR